MYKNNPKLDQEITEFLVSLKIPVKAQTFIPMGEESFGWRVDTDKRNFFVKYCNNEKVLSKLPSINSLLTSINDLDFVVAPVLIEGKSEIEFLDGYIYLYPFVEGEVLTVGNHEFEEDLVRQLVTIMSEIHNVELDLVDIPVESFKYDFDLQFQTILDDIGRGLFLPEVTNDELLKIENMIKHFNELSHQFRIQNPRMVLTHGDITGMNILRTADGEIKLLDWDGALLAPKERDLNFLYDNPSFDFEYYQTLTSSDELNPKLRDYYGYVWSLDSILENMRKLQVYKNEYGAREDLLEDVKEYLGYY